MEILYPLCFVVWGVRGCTDSPQALVVTAAARTAGGDSRGGGGGGARHSLWQSFMSITHT